jgi:hypothetical protein
VRVPGSRVLACASPENEWREVAQPLRRPLAGILKGSHPPPMALLLLLPPDASPDDRQAFICAALWLADGLDMVPCFGSPVRPGDLEGSPYPPITDADR